MNQDMEEIPFTSFTWIFGAFILIALLFPALVYMQHIGLIQEEKPEPAWFNWMMTIFFILITFFLFVI